MKINTPIYCITSDMDWASEYCNEEFVKIITSYGIKPTIFATHESAIIKKSISKGEIECGIHPNFLPGSSHGSDCCSIIDNMFSMYPEAKTFRSHSYFDSTSIIQEMTKRGINYDSNICLYLQPDIVPLNHPVGMTRFPVFWEDDCHWINTNGDWNLKNYLKDFLSPGIKIFNFHPFNVAVNIPNQKYYNQVKNLTQTLSKDTSNNVFYKDGNGVRTFLIELLEFFAKRQERIYTLSELYRMFPINDFLIQEDETKGTTTNHTDEDYERYWNMTDKDRQKYIRASYEKRDAKHIYGTSRDFNARELEIDSIKRNINQKGKILDLGCGNGYTLLSLAKYFKDWDMIGIDFSDNLIDGAMYHLNKTKDKLKSIPKFICADAIDYIKNTEADSFKYVITERFILNMPSVDIQKNIIKEIYRILKSGGKLLMCEGSADGFKSLNNLRESVGLDRIPETSADNISAIRLKDDEIEYFTKTDVGFKLISKNGFSSFYLMSRVLHPLLVAPQMPRFDARINELARIIQEKLPHEEGFSGIALWVFEK